MSYQEKRREFIKMLGGSAVVASMSHEDKADAAEHAQIMQTNRQLTAMDRVYRDPIDELLAEGDDAAVRSGTGLIFGIGKRPVTRLSAMPNAPTLMDFFEHRFEFVKNHCLQSAADALKKGQREEIVLACLLHDVTLTLMRVDHGWWGAQMLEPYVSEKISWAIRYHQALRFFPDDTVGYEYPVYYKQLFGEDYEPDEYIVEAYNYARGHKWYMNARAITVHDQYAFDPDAEVSLDPFVDIVGRHFMQPKEGLGFDGSAVSHMWRSIIFADNPL